MPRVSVRWLPAVVALSAAIGVVAPATASTARPPLCRVANLRLDKIGGQGFTSHHEWDFALRNVGSSSCRVQGYPALALLDAHAHRVAYTVQHHPSRTRAVVLATWKRAYFAFVYTVAGPCTTQPPAIAYGLQVAPHGVHGRLAYYAGRFALCGGGVASETAVSAHRPS